MFVDSLARILELGSQSNNLRPVKMLHAHLLRTGFLFNLLDLQTKLIFTYSTLLHPNSLQIFKKFFKSINPINPLSFNILLSDFSRNGFSFIALQTLSFMHINGVALDTYALCSSLTASSSIKSVKFGEQIHAHVAKSGWSASVFVGSALIDSYAKASFIDYAALVFDDMPVKNTVCANALLSGFVETKRWVEGIELVRNMPSLNLTYDCFTLSAVLRACAGVSAIELGKQTHAYALRMIPDIEADAFLQSSLIEMYGKCGLVVKASQAFSMAGVGETERRRDVVLWTSMLGVYGRNGYFSKVIELFKKMLIEGNKPDGVAFLTVISACRYTGELELGIQYFDFMVHKCRLDPGPEHYSCMIDLLCRAGELEKAWKLMNEMLGRGYCKPTIAMWGALLNACDNCGNLVLGRIIAQEAMSMDPYNAGIYVLLSNLYAKYEMWDELGQLRESMKCRGLNKGVGCSWIQVDDCLLNFINGMTSLKKILHCAGNL
ncbi:Pentatricopeptide repeat [Dillenia turbinata]|uniref:Pentatricopeptide repeat n=1 Tax=Dillenia turbinata TaxID=194707 RepID=A0AAN8ZBE8_9MAGN